jgi:rubrerythrin
VFALDQVDAGGAIREAEDAVAGDTRAAFFRKAAVGGGAVLSSGAIMGMLPDLAAAARPSAKQDLAILKYALTLEYLESAFYKEAVASGALSGAAKDLAALVANHEAVHVKTLRSVLRKLGAKVPKSPTFDFQGTNRDQAKFVATSFVLENTGVRAYLGQAANLKSKALLVAAAEIVTIEARHASAFAILQNSAPFTNGAKGGITPFGAFDKPATKAQILKAVGATKFITG